MDLLDDSVSGVFVTLDDHTHIGCFGEEGFDFSYHSLHADALAAVEDFVLRGDSKEDGIFFERTRPTHVRLVHLYPSFLNEHGGYDEEDQEDENAVDHRGEIDVHGFFGIVAYVAA